MTQSFNEIIKPQSPTAINFYCNKKTQQSIVKENQFIQAK
jgi:hypothetical protein